MFYRKKRYYINESDIYRDFYRTGRFSRLGVHKVEAQEFINRGDYHYARNVVGSPDFIVYDNHLDRAYRIEMKVIYDDRKVNRDSIRDCLSSSQLSWWDRKQYDDNVDSDYFFVLVYVKRERRFYLINYKGLDDERYPIYRTDFLLKVFDFLKKYQPPELSRRKEPGGCLAFLFLSCVIVLLCVLVLWYFG